MNSLSSGDIVVPVILIQTLTSLNLELVPISDEGAIHVAEVLKINQVRRTICPTSRHHLV